MADAHFLVSDEVVKIQLQKQLDQDNLVRRVARDIAQGEVSIQFFQDKNELCTSARTNIRRLSSLGFRCRLEDIYVVDSDFYKCFESRWLITLPQH